VDCSFNRDKSCPNEFENPCIPLLRKTGTHSHERNRHATQGTGESLQEAQRKYDLASLRFVISSVKSAHLGEVFSFLKQWNKFVAWLTKFCQVLTNIETMEKANAVKSLESTGRYLMAALYKSLEDLQIAAKGWEINIIKCQQILDLQNKSILHSKGNVSVGGSKGRVKQFSHRLDYEMQNKLREAQIALELARVNPVIASRRVSVAQDTLALLHSLVDVKKTSAELDKSLAAKSKARLHSQVP
jgi:hypothetical protein